MPSNRPWWAFEPKFKPVAGRYEPVPGGRWSVRKMRYNHSGPIKKRPWKAWTTGKASSYTMWFATQTEAIEWATTMAHLWRFKRFGEMDGRVSDLRVARRQADRRKEK